MKIPDGHKFCFRFGDFASALASAKWRLVSFEYGVRGRNGCELEVTEGKALVPGHYQPYFYPTKRNKF